MSEPTAARFAWRPAAIAALVGFTVFAGGTGAESLIIRAVRGDRIALEWISDALISTAAASLAYLWMRLRDSRTNLLDAERKAVALDEQLRLAATIQRNLLPDIPPTTRGYGWAARMVPAGLIGGDFYDFIETSSGATLVILGDVSGKGIPAALLHSSLKAVFRMIALDTTDPAAIAERIAAVLHGQTGGLPYATAIVARFEHAPPRLTYVNAGHPSGLLLRNGAAIAIAAGGLPLGMLPDTHYASVQLELREGDTGVLVTDGITEALEGLPMSLDNALRTPDTACDMTARPEAICDRLLARAAAAPGPIGTTDWQDDATVFVFHVTRPS